MFTSEPADLKGHLPTQACADSKQRLLTAENSRALRASKINSALMRPLNEPVRPAEVAGLPPGAISLEQAWTEAEQSNPDLRDLDARVRAKEESVSSVRAEYLPSVFVSGGYEYNENKYQVHQDNWAFIAGVNINLSAGGATSSKVGMAKSELLSLKITREKLLDAVRLDVQAAWLTCRAPPKRSSLPRRQWRRHRRICGFSGSGTRKASGPPPMCSMR